MDRFQNRVEAIRDRNKYRYFNDQKIMRVFDIKTDLTQESDDRIEQALWDIKQSMDLPTEEIERAIESRRKVR